MPVPVRPLGVEPDPFKNYLGGMREDDLLDGLIGGGGGCNPTGGGWANDITGMGTWARDKTVHASYNEPFRIDDTQISAMLNGNDLAQRIIVTKPREMFRRGWVLVIKQDGDPDGTPATTLPTGQESGPAAPGAPLVAPIAHLTDGPGSDGDHLNTVAPASGDGNARPGQFDPMGEKVAKPPPATVHPAYTPKKTKKTAKKTGDTDNQSDNADLAIATEAYASRLGLIPKCLEACIFGRAYGGGLLIIGANDGQDMSLPLNENEIKSIEYLVWMDRRFIFASTWYTDVGPRFGEPETYTIVNPFGGQQNTYVHESRVIRFEGAPVDFLMRRRLLGWTLSVLQAPYDIMRMFDMSFQSVGNLMADMSQAVMSINGLAQLISNDQKTLQTRMAMVDMSRSSGRMLYIDADNEKFERTATPMTGVADALEMMMLRMAAACEMPVAILFGREPSGLNATGDADFRRFYDTIAGAQKQDLEPKLRRLYSLICLAKDSPTGGKMPENGLEFVFHKLYEPSEKEQAEIRWLMAQADEKYVMNKILLPEEIAMSRFRNGDIHLDTEINIELRQGRMAEAELPPTAQDEAEDQKQQAADATKTTLAVAGMTAKPVAGGAAKPPAKP